MCTYTRLLRSLTKIASLACLLAVSLSAAETTLNLPALPGPLTLVNNPVFARISPEGAFEMGAVGKTNLFNNPNGKNPTQNAPMALFEPKGDFVFSAKVSAKLNAVYDVAALVIYENAGSWAKLCFENSVNKEATIVSVVTRGLSDDCNSQTTPDAFAYLAIVRKGTEYSFHSSRDGKTWQLIRHFNLVTQSPIKIGFAVHGSVGNGLEAAFSSVEYRTQAPEKMRSLR